MKITKIAEPSGQLNNIIDQFMSSLTKKEQDALSSDSGGWCWYFTKKFNEFLNDNGVPNKVYDLRTKQINSGNHFVNYLPQQDIIVDFTYNQFTQNSSIPLITNREDFEAKYKGYLPEVYDNFEDFWSGAFKNLDEFIQYLANEKIPNPAAQYYIEQSGDVSTEGNKINEKR